MNEIRSAEYVLPGHPDKVCDRIADAIVDAAAIRDPDALVGVEVACHRNVVFVDGRVAGREVEGCVDVDAIVRRVYAESGYGGPWGPAPGSLDIRTDLCLGDLRPGEREIRGHSDDQSIVVGHACGDETTNHLPLEHYVAWRLARSLDGVRREHTGILGPDGKVLVVMEAARVKTVSLSIHHAPEAELDRLFVLAGEVVKRAADGLPGLFPDPDDLDLRLNGAGSFAVGGPMGDNGLSGKKLVVDFYGPRVAIGGGALSGKDAHKVDRLGAFRARHIAKGLVMSGIAAEATVHLAYTPGAEAGEVVRIEADCPPRVLERWPRAYDLTIEGTFREFGLAGVRFEPLAAWGHFTSAGAPWEAWACHAA